MKLYTEEQVKEAIDLARVTLSDKSPYPKYIILSEIKGIELPSEDEIEEKAEFLFPTVNRMGGPTYIAHKSFIEGTKWMRDKIINQNK